jgi:hypothetical protein
MVYTNFPQLLNLYVPNDRIVVGTPVKLSTNNNTINDKYEAQVDDMLDIVLGGNGVILIFKETSRDFYFSSKDMILCKNKSKYRNRLSVRDYQDALLILPQK